MAVARSRVKCFTARLIRTSIDKIPTVIKRTFHVELGSSRSVVTVRRETRPRILRSNTPSRRTRVVNRLATTSGIRRLGSRIGIAPKVITLIGIGIAHPVVLRSIPLQIERSRISNGRSNIGFGCTRKRFYMTGIAPFLSHSTRSESRCTRSIRRSTDKRILTPPLIQQTERFRRIVVPGSTQITSHNLLSSRSNAIITRVRRSNLPGLITEESTGCFRIIRSRPNMPAPMHIRFVSDCRRTINRNQSIGLHYRSSAFEITCRSKINITVEQFYRTDNSSFRSSTGFPQHLNRLGG